MKKSPQISFFSIIFLLFSIYTSYSQDISSCGLMSAISLARYYGSTINENDLENLHQSYTQNDLSIFDVKEAANKLGVKTDGMKINLEELEALNRPFIALVTNHFVFVESINNKWIRYIDNNIIKIDPKSEFAKIYTGKSR